jgi:predicted nucleotidyltransferase
MNKIGDTLIHAGANKELIRAFLANGVEFVVIGGLAVAWYCSDRQAKDMDLLINPTPENSARISQTLDRLKILGHTDKSFTKFGLQVPLKQNYYAELLTPGKDGPTYSEIANDAVEAKLFNISVRIASVASLILLKEQAVKSAEVQRDKHLKDIERLKKYSV